MTKYLSTSHQLQNKGTETSQCWVVFIFQLWFGAEGGHHHTFIMSIPTPHTCKIFYSHIVHMYCNLYGDIQFPPLFQSSAIHISTPIWATCAFGPIWVHVYTKWGFGCFIPINLKPIRIIFIANFQGFKGVFFLSNSSYWPCHVKVWVFWLVVGVCSTYVSSCSWLIAGKTSKNCNQRCVLFVRCRFPFCCVINILKGTSFGRDIFQGGGSLVYFPVMSDYSPVLNESDYDDDISLFWPDCRKSHPQQKGPRYV